MVNPGEVPLTTEEARPSLAGRKSESASATSAQTGSMRAMSRVLRYVSNRAHDVALL